MNLVFWLFNNILDSSCLRALVVIKIILVARTAVRKQWQTNCLEVFWLRLCCSKLSVPSAVHLLVC